MSKYISLLSLFFIHKLQAQTGEGCYFKTCSTPTQVRIDAKWDITGAIFLGGCNCACNPAMADPASALYCGSPRKVNFDSKTWIGDCSCNCPEITTPITCELPQTYNPNTCGCSCPSTSPLASACVIPQEFLAKSCECGCEIGKVGGECLVGGQFTPGSLVLSDCTCNTGSVQCLGNQVPDSLGKCGCPAVAANGQRFPSCSLPLVKDPITCDCATTTTTIPPAGPIAVTCESVGACSCPYGTKGTCTINCDIGNDACKDGLIECNNNGFDCNVNCMTGSACAGSAKIIGPVGGKLNVKCTGGQSCEGSTIIDNEFGTDLNVICDGSQSCKGGVTMLFGNGIGSVACNGAPDSCQGMQGFSFVIPAAAQGFSCTGPHCPPGAPDSFGNIHGPGFTPSLPVPVPGPVPVPVPGVLVGPSLPVVPVVPSLPVVPGVPGVPSLPGVPPRPQTPQIPYPQYYQNYQNYPNYPNYPAVPAMPIAPIPWPHHV